MKIAIALRTCDQVYSTWKLKRKVEADKQTIILTCLNSLLDAISTTKHEVVFSIHDDNSSEETLDHIEWLCDKYGVKYELFQTEKLGNFKSQYEWMKSQIDADFLYAVEDDYLHDPNIFDLFIDMHQYLVPLVNQPGIDYAFYPWNNPQRYETFEYIYPVMVFKRNGRYWRSELQSTHTFFVTRNTFDQNDKVMKHQAYTWPNPESWDFRTITMVWREQVTRLVVPLDSLAYHLTDIDVSESESLWRKYHYEVR